MQYTSEHLAIPVFLKKSWSTCVAACREANIVDNTFNALMDPIEFEVDDFEFFFDETFKETINN